jgi:hypothetical protein
MNILIAIDPGQSGGIAVAYGTDVLNVMSMPPTEGDVHDVLAEVAAVALHEGWLVVAVIEEVGGYVGGGGQPGSAMFKFGRGFGFLLGVLAALKIRTELVRPQKWQAALSLGNSKSHASKTAWKNHLKAKAQKLYPNVKVTLATADALLLLEYARPKSFSAG